MSFRVLTVLLAVALVVLAAYFLAFQQTVAHEVDLRAGELKAPASEAAAFAEFRWYANQLESLAIESYSRGAEMDSVRIVMHGALDDLWGMARATSDTTRCDFIQCDPRVCAPWCPDISQFRGDGGE